MTASDMPTDATCSVRHLNYFINKLVTTTEAQDASGSYSASIVKFSDRQLRVCQE